MNEIEYQNPLKKLFDRKDFLIILLISVIYAVVAYVNLGSMTAPTTQCAMEDSVVLQLEADSQVSEIRYYAGIGEGTIEFEYSTDGVNYQTVNYTEGDNAGNPALIEYKNADMYVYRKVKTDITATYIKIDVLKPGMNINEIAVVNADGQLLPLLSAYSADTSTVSTKSNPAALIDEQEIVPAHPTYMDEMYFDEIYHGRTAFEMIHHMDEYEITHPPLGKIIMTIGLNLFGMTPFGWRCVGTFFGVLLLPLMYILAKSIIKKRKYAIIATVLFSVDFMHFSQTRIGTIDSYSIFFIMLMMLFMYQYTQTNFNRQPLKKTLLPLFLCGLSFGLGAATKWLCIYAGGGLLVLFVYCLIQRFLEYRSAKKEPEPSALQIDIVKNYKKNVILTLLWCILFFIVIPGIIYILAYIPYCLVETGKAIDLKAIWGNQKYMLNYHANLNPDKPHPFASKWYTWPLDIRPLLFYNNQTVAGEVSTMSTMGNPFIWIGGLVAGLAMAMMAIFKKFRSKEAGFVAIALLTQIVPWVLVTREVFIYHYFATVPFLIILLTIMLKLIDENTKRGKKFTMWYVIICVAAFAAFYPVISGLPVPSGYIPFIRWLPSWPFY